MELSSFHKERYGRYNTKADPEKCAEDVRHDWHTAQCNRLRGHGPEGAFCKQHDPAAKKARAEASNRKYKLDSWSRYGHSAAKATVGQALLDHLDQKCTFDDVVKVAEEYRARAKEMEELRNDAR